MCYPVCGMVHTNEPLLLFEKSSPCSRDSRLICYLSDPFTICLMPYNCKYSVLSVSLNKTLPLKQRITNTTNLVRI